MRILKELEDTKLLIVELKARLREKVRSAPTLYVKIKGKLYL